MTVAIASVVEKEKVVGLYKRKKTHPLKAMSGTARVKMEKALELEMS